MRDLRVVRTFQVTGNTGPFWANTFLQDDILILDCSVSGAIKVVNLEDSSEFYLREGIQQFHLPEWDNARFRFELIGATVGTVHLLRKGG